MVHRGIHGTRIVRQEHDVRSYHSLLHKEWDLAVLGQGLFTAETCYNYQCGQQDIIPAYKFGIFDLCHHDPYSWWFLQVLTCINRPPRLLFYLSSLLQQPGPDRRN